MVAQIIDGKAIAEQILLDLEGEVEQLSAGGLTPTLASIQVGEYPSNWVYVRQQQQACARLGIEYLATQMPARSSERAVCTMLESLNQNPDVHGIILQVPLPKGMNRRKVQATIRPDKDVEGLHPQNVGQLVHGRTGLAPCTAMAVLELIQSTGISLKGKEVTVVGAGAVSGKPLSILLSNELCTVTLCHIATEDVKFHTTRAEIVVLAAGKAGLLTADMVKPGAVVVDVGINSIDRLDPDGKPVLDKKGRPRKAVVGDADFAGVSEVAGYITPVPGGVGPVTVAVLMRNIVEAARLAAA